MSASIPRNQLAGVVLHLGVQTDRRAALRKLVTPIIARTPKRQIVNAFSANPYIDSVGPCPAKRISPQPTHAGLRDALSEPAIIGLLMNDGATFAGAAPAGTHATTMGDVLAAIGDPSGASLPSARSKTGFEFGRHIGLTAMDATNNTEWLMDQAKTLGHGATRAQIIDALEREGIPHSIAARATDALAAALTTSGTITAKGTATHEGDRYMKLPLTDLVNIHDTLVTDGHSTETITDAMHEVLVSVGQPAKTATDLLNGLNAVVEARPAAPTEPGEIATGDANEFLAKVRDRLAGASATKAAVEETTAFAVPDLPNMEVPEATKSMLNAVLVSQSLPTIDDLFTRMAAMHKAASEAISQAGDLRAKLASTTMLASFAPKVDGATSEVDGDGNPIAPGTLPEGKVTFKKACDVFAIKGKAAAAFQFEVPVFEWAFNHPHVPDVDSEYLFRPDSLITVLVSLINNQRPWLHGHTGTGKSTLVEQVAARLQWPVMRVNFDSEITRMDLTGRDTLTVDPTTGQTITKWVDGILPTALKGPYILLLDEIDFVRPDVSYVLQRCLEGKGLLLTENGGELVVPHSMCRIVATANTVGQGDEHGLYQGARPQSMALLDRFKPFINMPYLSKDEEKALIVKRNPTIDAPAAETIAKYVVEHRQAFTNAEILQPISPRGISALAQQYLTFTSIYGDPKKAMKRAFEDMVLAGASQQDAAVLSGLVNRVTK